VLQGPPAPAARHQALVRLVGAPVAAAVDEFELVFDFGEDDDDEAADEVSHALPDQSIGLSAPVEDAEEQLPIANMTVAQIREELKEYGIAARGRKLEMMEALKMVRLKRIRGVPTNDLTVHQDTQMHWYMLQTANGFEGTVERSLNMMIDVHQLESQIEEVFVPILEGETSIRMSSVMPSYIFVRMKMSRELHQQITSMQFVLNFVGADRGGRSRGGQMDGTRGFVWPRPMSEEAFAEIVALTRQKEQAEEAEQGGNFAFSVDELVKVTQGPFKGLEGRVVALGQVPTDAITVAVTIMGRETSVDIATNHCEALPDPEAAHEPILGVTDVGHTELRAAGMEAEDRAGAVAPQL